MAGDGNSLEVVAPPYQQIILTPADLKAMRHITVGVHDAHGKVLETYSGVSLFDLIDRLARITGPNGTGLRGKPWAEFIVATGAGGYKAVVALAEADPDLHPANVLVADTLDGKPLDGKEGPFELIVPNDRNPGRSVRKLVTIELKTAE
jgi:hypothetical protein